jgi:hypothetical protein
VDISIPDFIPYFLAILGLLLIWQLHEVQVQAGRVDAMDFWVVSGIRLFFYGTPCDTSACRPCRSAHGLGFLPSFVASKHFREQIPRCGNPIGCRCLLVGIYGAWPEAERARKQIKWNRLKIHLTDEQLQAMVEGGKSRRAGFSADRISLMLLEAMQLEKTDSKAAINRYRFVVEEAEEKRDLPFVISAYLRLSDLLETVGEDQEAHEVVMNFLERYSRTGGRKRTALLFRKSRYRPTEGQLAVMSARRTRLEAHIAGPDSTPPSA